MYFFICRNDLRAGQYVACICDLRSVSDQGPPCLEIALKHVTRQNCVFTTYIPPTPSRPFFLIVQSSFLANIVVLMLYIQPVTISRLLWCSCFVPLSFLVRIGFKYCRAIAFCRLHIPDYRKQKVTCLQKTLGIFCFSESTAEKYFFG